MDYETYLLETLFDGDKDRFEEAWQEATAEGRKEAITWASLMDSTETPEPRRLDLASFEPYTGLSYKLTTLTFNPFTSFFVWRTQR
ncbi:hypothetical protein BWI96_10560 [Siphonobacter sp. SORGH_AS_0500]|uniref:hypothetical protein n=1 Tax=Siphonobacter sp. SORGH_AS_0500 TaxID=1864824 RepID=UPI000CCAA5E5|nr:hypothetical protein [Siphonobacter sp. SORGH_AS_0500]PKK36803.1 hypothetical protein BWI96_10560 [Siphonobacter sp. SORGH_AS_0500]